MALGEVLLLFGVWVWREWEVKVFDERVYER
jgi:hypothetical protein